MSIDKILFGQAEHRMSNALATVGGKKVEGALTFEQIRDEVFTYDAIEADLTATVLDENGVTTKVVPKHKAILRSDTMEVVGVVGRDAATHQPREWVADAIELLTSGTDLQVQSAGTVNNGAQIWLQVALEQNRKGPGGFDFRPFLLGGTGIDGSMSTTFKRNSIAIWCENTYRASFKRSESMEVRIRHTRNSQLRIGEARRMLDLIVETGDEFERELEELLAVGVSDLAFERLIREATAGSTDTERSKSIAERKQGELLNLWRNDVRVAQWRGTGLGAMQAFSTWRQHVATVKNVDRTVRNSINVLNGTSDREDLRTFERIMALA